MKFTTSFSVNRTGMLDVDAALMTSTDMQAASLPPRQGIREGQRLLARRIEQEHAILGVPDNGRGMFNFFGKRPEGSSPFNDAFLYRVESGQPLVSSHPRQHRLGDHVGVNPRAAGKRLYPQEYAAILQGWRSLQDTRDHTEDRPDVFDYQLTDEMVLDPEKDLPDVIDAPFMDALLGEAPHGPPAELPEPAPATHKHLIYMDPEVEDALFRHYYAAVSDRVEIEGFEPNNAAKAMVYALGDYVGLGILEGEDRYPGTRMWDFFGKDYIEALRPRYPHLMGGMTMAAQAGFLRRLFNRFHVEGPLEGWLDRKKTPPADKTGGRVGDHVLRAMLRRSGAGKEVDIITDRLLTTKGTRSQFFKGAGDRFEYTQGQAVFQSRQNSVDRDMTFFAGIPPSVYGLTGGRDDDVIIMRIPNRKVNDILRL